MVSLVYILSKGVDCIFAVHKLEKFSSNPGKVNFEGLLHLLIYIRDKKNLGLKYYSKIDDSPLSGLLRQSSIKTENQLMMLSDSRWKDCPYTGISTGDYIVCFINVYQLIIAHMLQDQFLNLVLRVNTIQHVPQ